ncbi:hypothetical protein LPJ59_004252 [Coemansia sp. RSA 2399]|nr:hypothetical protein LPJ59_004252 [Coemansia sp. RSA 2399]KAJ1900856.1 hypothetical protein LPJ81_003859 [Coemansia sp. IMI 209127]
MSDAQEVEALSRCVSAQAGEFVFTVPDDTLARYPMLSHRLGEAPPLTQAERARILEQYPRRLGQEYRFDPLPTAYQVLGADFLAQDRDSVDIAYRFAALLRPLEAALTWVGRSAEPHGNAAVGLEDALALLHDGINFLHEVRLRRLRVSLGGTGGRTNGKRRSNRCNRSGAGQAPQQPAAPAPAAQPAAAPAAPRTAQDSGGSGGGGRSRGGQNRQRSDYLNGQSRPRNNQQ